MAQFILVYSHPREGEKRFELVPNRSYRIGSMSDNDIVIDKKDVSRHHAVVRVHDGFFHITDLDSKNGTFLNGSKIVSSTFNCGDMLHLSSARLVIVEVGDGAYPLVPEVDDRFDDESGVRDRDDTQKFRSEASMEDLISLLETTASAVRRGALADPLTWAVDHLGFDAALVLYRDDKDNVAMVSSAGDLGQLARNSSVLARLATDHQLARSVGTRVQQVAELGENLLVATIGREHVLVVRYSGRSPAIGDLRSVIASISAVLGAGASGVAAAGRSTPDPLSRILGVSEAILSTKRAAREEARHNGPIFVIGEPGSGRSLIARTIHDLSVRASRPFVEIDLEGLDAEGIERCLLVASEAMAVADSAADGSLVLDRVAAMPAPLWQSIVSALADRSAAPPRLTIVVNADPEIEDRLGDLDERKVAQVRIPSLRHRREDIPILVNAFVREICGVTTDRPAGFTVGIFEAFAAHDWPGNVTELSQEVAHLMAGAVPGVLVDVSDLSTDLAAALLGRGRLPLDLESLAGAELASARDAFERWAIGRALDACGRNQSKAAKQLGLSRAGLFKKMRRLGI